MTRLLLLLAILTAFPGVPHWVPALLTGSGGSVPSLPSARLSPDPLREAGATMVGGAGQGIPVSPAPSADYATCETPCFVRIDVPGPPLTFGGLHPIQEGWYRGVASGIASHMGYVFPASYLALPIGPGFRVRITGPAGYVVMTSTDAGPALHLQRPPYNRVADLSVSVFVRICGVPASMGLCPVSVVIEGRAKP